MNRLKLFLQSDAGSEPYKAAKDIAKAQQLFKEAGYNGEPITILQATDHQYITPAGHVLTQQLRRAGFLNLDVQSMDWGTVVSRRAKKEPPAQGGWNIFITGTTVLTSSNPITHTSIGMGCDKAWFGWPCDPEMEKLRASYAREVDPAKQKEIAMAVQDRVMDQASYIVLGQYKAFGAYRKDRVDGWLQSPAAVWWNISKK